jgi:hypothetical protein
MDIGWREERCIHRLGVPNADDPDSVMTKGHVIPQSIGGKLYACNECKRCNDRAGHGAEAAPVGDLGPDVGIRGRARPVRGPRRRRARPIRRVPSLGGACPVIFHAGAVDTLRATLVFESLAWRMIIVYRR